MVYGRRKRTEEIRTEEIRTEEIRTEKVLEKRALFCYAKNVSTYNFMETHRKLFL